MGNVVVCKKKKRITDYGTVIKGKTPRVEKGNVEKGKWKIIEI